MKFKKILSLLSLIIFTVLNLKPVSAETITFRDVPSDFWGKVYIDFISEKCNITGFKNQNGSLLYEFRPNSYLTRAELAQMLAQCQQNSNVFSGETSPFTDVQKNNWFFNAVMAGVKMGWWQGYTDKTFRPQNNVTRAEGLKMILLTKHTEEEMNGFSVNFKDVKSSDWAYKFIAFGYNKGKIDGFSDGTFRPNNRMTRAEAAKMITNVMEPVACNPTSSGCTPPAPAPNPTPSPSPSPSPSPVPPTSGTSPQIAGCPIFPADNPWNTDISNYPVHPNSRNFINSIGSDSNIHPDFGSNADYGIPYTVVDSSTPKITLEIEYADESEPGPYPIPDNVDIEGGSDQHIIVLDKDSCKLYETWNSERTSSGWSVGSAAIFDLRSNALRPEGWTSADAAGLPILPGLVRYDEVKSGSINHALRFTISQSQKGYIHPATHYASSSTDPNLPPMGLRLRLKADFDISGYSGDARVILEALKKYGMFVADNGSDWFISGQKDSRWNDEDLSQLKNIPGSAFEVVDTGPIIN